jgi:uncharacterized protein YndB with AHSA1/START domain
MTLSPTARPVISVSLDPGTVSVRTTVPVALGEAWAGLAEGSHIGCWFGELSGELRPGAHVRLDFADGDFFDIEVVTVTPPSRLVYEWRFLGIGPRCRVEWHAGDAAGGTEVVVADSVPGRPAEESAELGRGWVDFLERYRSYLSTGRRSRYGWRPEIDGSIELAADAQWLFDDDVYPKWLTLGREAGAGRIHDVARPSPARLEVALGTPGGPPVSTGHLELSPRPTGALLSFTHQDWERLAPSGHDVAGVRRRIIGTWIESMVGARAMLER